MTKDPFRTYHANQALELSELVNLQFARTRFGSTDPRMLRMREPDGPSTDAGRKARQPLVLVRNNDDESGLVFGFVDLFKRTADLRGYPTVRQHHEQRFGHSLSLTRNEYTRLLEELKAFLESQAIETRVVNSARPPSTVTGLPAVTPSMSVDAPPQIALLPLFLSGILGFALCYLLVIAGVMPV